MSSRSQGVPDDAENLTDLSPEEEHRGGSQHGDQRDDERVFDEGLGSSRKYQRIGLDSIYARVDTLYMNNTDSLPVQKSYEWTCPICESVELVNVPADLAEARHECVEAYRTEDAI
jgi:hypothetical protein